MRRFCGVTLTGMAFGLVFVAPAAGATASSDGRVFRFRAGPQEPVRIALDRAEFAPGHVPTDFVATASVLAFAGRVDAGPGCGLRTRAGALQVACPLSAPVERRSLRYRFSLGDRNDEAIGVDPLLLHGVIYAGAGEDEVYTGDRVYGGDGDDRLDFGGRVVYGGRGNDFIGPADYVDIKNVLRGGRGRDLLFGPGWLYGGPGDDRLRDSGANRAGVPDMLVGGPGRDFVELEGGGRTVVRLRGGGVDSVTCFRPLPPTNVLYLDRSDRLLDRDCKSGRILFTGRPRPPA